MYVSLNRLYLKKDLNLHVDHVFEKTFLDAATYGRVIYERSNICFSYNSASLSPQFLYTSSLYFTVAKEAGNI